MKPAQPRPGDPEAVEATAAVWLSLRDRGLTEHETAEFVRWLQESPRHAEVFAELDAVWKTLDRAEALRPAAAPRIAGAAAPVSAAVRVSRCRRLAWGALATAAALALAWVGWERSALRPTAETAVGAFQKLDLPDGSVVQLNTDSAIKVRYTDAERRVELLRGEAHFDVAKNPARPFVVAADHVAVRAVGTAFNVRLRPEAVEVLVTEGRVRVDDAAGGGSLLAPAPDRPGPPVLVEGEKVLVPVAAVTTASAAPVAVAIREVPEVEVRRALAWQERRLEFEDLPLAAVVAEFNRYNRTQLLLVDPALGSRRFSGTFRADAYEPFVRLLEENFGVRAEHGANGIELRAAK